MEVRRKIGICLKKTSQKTSKTNALDSTTSQSLEISSVQHSNVSTVDSVQAEVVSEVNEPVNTNMPDNINMQASPNKAVNTNTSEGLNESISGSSQHTIDTNQQQVRIAKPKLPKLSLPKYKGDVKKWHGFMESLIHKNDEMSPIDKFNYLTTLLEEEAARAIQGLPLTNANYIVAIDILKDRFGKTQAIVTAHMDELLKLPNLGSNCRLRELRAVLDLLTIHVGGLETLGISDQQYSSLLTPIVMSKLPADVRLIVTRAMKGSALDLKSILDLLKVEVEAREASFSLKTHDSNLDNRKPWEKNRTNGGKGTATGAFLTNSGIQPGSITCAFCSKSHYSASCEEVKDISQRKDILMRERRCFLCLKRGHRASECTRSIHCRNCKKRHHQSICASAKGPEDPEQKKPSNPEPKKTSNPNTTQSDKPTSLTAASFTQNPSVLPQTATALARATPSSKAIPVRILFDGGSQRSYVTRDLKDRLGLRSTHTETLNLNTFGDKMFRKQKCELVQFELFNKDGDVFNVSTLTFPKICSALPSKVDLSSCPIFAKLDLASDSGCDDQPIDVLVGSDLYWQFISGKVIRSETGLVAVQSKFGWILSGVVADDHSEGEITVSNLVITREVGTSEPMDDLKSSLQRFWKTESIGIYEEPEEKCIKTEQEQFQINIEREAERYSVNLPWKTDDHPLPTHLELSKARLTYLQKRLQNNKELMKKYADIIAEQLQAGIIESVSQENEGQENSQKIHYLPHHAVVREDKSTTKVRIVFNRSAKLNTEELSINECLERGPNLVPSLFHILVRFRSHPYALVADIEKAFHMISIKQEDRYSLRFLWLKSVENGLSEVAVYRFCRLVFGLKTSPAILGATIKHHLSHYSMSDPETAGVLENDLYVDDLATGTEYEDKAITLYKSANDVMMNGGFNLRKWKSNSSRVRQYIANCEQDSAVPVSDDDSANHALFEQSENVTIAEDDLSYAKVSVNPLSSDESCEAKVLGVTWNFVNDTLKYRIQDLVLFARQLPVTKRSILRMSARVFDPLGLITPFSIILKILFQQLCLDSAGWDDQLNDSLKVRWEKLILQLPALGDITVPRYCFLLSKDDQVVELHGFSDASTKAYAAAIYARVVNGDAVQTTLLCAKSRVAPVKTQTVPRLELLGALLLARLMDSVLKALSDCISVDNVFYWTDSITVVC